MTTENQTILRHADKKTGSVNKNFSSMRDKSALPLLLIISIIQYSLRQYHPYKKISISHEIPQM